ncbi:STAS domain-containing protein [Streptomyces sp. NPDC057445]|uniref:STAS domain-containing protein n=1 Tax=Streptomyces sp. NPDC057445 TaxID=3346136 RepID=UPI0036A6A04B
MSCRRPAGQIHVDSTRQPLVLELIGRITPADVPLLCAQLRARGDTDAGPGEVICDAAGLTVADLTAVDAIARLRLTARRLGRDLRLRNAGPELTGLLDLVGLGDEVGQGRRPGAVSPPC